MFLEDLEDGSIEYQKQIDLPEGRKREKITEEISRGVRPLNLLSNLTL